MYGNQVVNSLLVIISLLALVFSFAGHAGPYAPRSIQALWNCGHVAAFFFWTLMLLQFYRPLHRCGFVFRLTACLLAAFSAGLLIELIQVHLGREASVQDLVNDLLGSLLAVSFWSACHDGYKPYTKWLALSSLVLVFVFNYRVFIYLYDEFAARSQFPVLLDLSTPFEPGRIEGNALADIRVTGEGRHLELILGTDRYSGFRIRHFPRDWRAYHGLVLRFNNPSANSLDITCRIHDIRHSDGYEEYRDRYNRSFELLPGKNRIVIDLEEVRDAPAGRQLDLEHVGELGCFAIQLPDNRRIILEDIALVQGPLH